MTTFMRQKLEERIWNNDYARISYKNHLLVPCSSTMAVKTEKKVLLIDYRSAESEFGVLLLS